MTTFLRITYTGENAFSIARPSRDYRALAPCWPTVRSVCLGRCAASRHPREMHTHTYTYICLPACSARARQMLAAACPVSAAFSAAAAVGAVSRERHNRDYLSARRNSRRALRLSTGTRHQRLYDFWASPESLMCVHSAGGPCGRPVFDTAKDGRVWRWGAAVRTSLRRAMRGERPASSSMRGLFILSTRQRVHTFHDSFALSPTHVRRHRSRHAGQDHLPWCGCVEVDAAEAMRPADIAGPQLGGPGAQRHGLWRPHARSDSHWPLTHTRTHTGAARARIHQSFHVATWRARRRPPQFKRKHAARRVLLHDTLNTAAKLNSENFNLKIFFWKSFFNVRSHKPTASNYV